MRGFKFVEAMPDPSLFIKNLAIKSGEDVLKWLGKLQGQINYRPQLYLNDLIAIKEPKIVRFYKEDETTHSFSSENPELYLDLTTDIGAGFEGQYLMNVHLIVGATHSNSVVSVGVEHNNRAIFSVTPSVKPGSTDLKIPVTLKRLLTVEEGHLNIKVMISRSNVMMSSPSAILHYGLIELLKIS